MRRATHPDRSVFTAILSLILVSRKRLRVCEGKPQRNGMRVKEGWFSDFRLAVYMYCPKKRACTRLDVARTAYL